MILPLEIASLPIRQFVEIFSAAAKHHIEVGVAQVLLQIASVHVAGQAVVSGEEQMQGVNIRGLKHIRQ